MAKSVKSLTGDAKDAYLRRLLADVPGLSPAAAALLENLLARDVTRLWVRASAKANQGTSDQLSVPEAAPQPERHAARTQTRQPLPQPARAATGPTDFDPYSPNVVVVLRKAGRDGALAALSAIREADHLWLLAREQQLGIEAGVSGIDELRLAIVDAAERRIANRRAAGS